AHRVVRHAPGRVGQRLLLRASVGAVLQRRKDREGPGGGLRRAQRDAARGGRTLARADPRLRAGARSAGVLAGRPGGVPPPVRGGETPPFRPPGRRRYCRYFNDSLAVSASFPFGSSSRYFIRFCFASAILPVRT